MEDQGKVSLVLCPGELALGPKPVPFKGIVIYYGNDTNKNLKILSYKKQTNKQVI